MTDHELQAALESVWLPPSLRSLLLAAFNQRSERIDKLVSANHLLVQEMDKAYDEVSEETQARWDASFEIATRHVNVCGACKCGLRRDDKTKGAECVTDEAKS